MFGVQNSNNVIKLRGLAPELGVFAPKLVKFALVGALPLGTHGCEPVDRITVARVVVFAAVVTLATFVACAAIGAPIAALLLNALCAHFPLGCYQAVVTIALLVYGLQLLFHIVHVSVCRFQRLRKSLGRQKGLFCLVPLARTSFCGIAVQKLVDATRAPDVVNVDDLSKAAQVSVRILQFPFKGSQFLIGAGQSLQIIERGARRHFAFVGFTGDRRLFSKSRWFRKYLKLETDYSGSFFPFYFRFTARPACHLSTAGMARCIPMYPPWPNEILENLKSVENRGYPPQTLNTCLRSVDYCIYVGETKTVDSSCEKPQRVASDRSSALVAVVRVVAVLDYANAEHVAALQNCPATSPWFSPTGKRAGIIMSHVVRLPEPLPYKGMQGLHYLPVGTKPATDYFVDQSKVQRLLDPEQEAHFANLHALANWNQGRKRTRDER